MHLTTKTESIEIDIGSKIDYELVINYAKLYKKHFLKKNVANNSNGSNKKNFVAKNKTQPNKMKIKSDKWEAKWSQSCECSWYGHNAHKCTN